MIATHNKSRGDVLWVLDIIGSETTFKPKQVIFDSPETIGSTKLVYVIEDGRRICYPTKVLFDDVYEAEACSAISFLRCHNSGCLGFEIPPNHLNALVSTAIGITEKYEKEYPDKFLYHWMQSP